MLWRRLTREQCELSLGVHAVVNDSLPPCRLPSGIHDSSRFNPTRQMLSVSQFVLISVNVAPLYIDKHGHIYNLCTYDNSEPLELFK